MNARETRNLPGRKSDVQESQWLLKLHAYGLLRKSFRPPAEILALRTCWRERAEYVQQAGMHIQRMQKALTEMNVQLATVLSDLSGVTGMKIVRAIAAGERDGKCLAEFRDPNVKASKETIAQSLEGTWRREQLAVLGRALAPFYIPTKVAKVSNSLLGDPYRPRRLELLSHSIVDRCKRQLLGPPQRRGRARILTWDIVSSRR